MPRSLTCRSTQLSRVGLEQEILKKTRNTIPVWWVMQGVSAVVDAGRNRDVQRLVQQLGAGAVTMDAGLGP